MAAKVAVGDVLVAQGSLRQRLLRVRLVLEGLRDLDILSRSKHYHACIEELMQLLTGDLTANKEVVCYFFQYTCLLPLYVCLFFIVFSFLVR